MKLSEKITYKKVEYLSEAYDKTLSFIIKEPAIAYPPPLFIFGSGRNGSTLISSILNNHSQIFIPPESSIIPFSVKYWYTNTLQTWETKLDRIFKELEQPSMWDIDLSELKLSLNTTKVVNQNINYILYSIYNEYARQYGQYPDVIWGDKTPSNTIYAHTIKKQFPHSKTLFLLRDPRAVVSSLLIADYKYYIKRIDHIIWRWKCCLKKYEVLKLNFTDLTMLLQYEHFVLEAHENISNVVNWMGLEFEEGMLENTAKNMSILGVTNAKHHQNIRNEITSNYINKWKSLLEPSIIARIEKKLASEMKRFSYL